MDMFVIPCSQYIGISASNVTVFNFQTGSRTQWYKQLKTPVTNVNPGIIGDMSEL